MLLLKLPSRKLEKLICSLKSLSSEVAFYFYKFTIYLDILSKLQKQVCKAAGHTLAASLLSMNFTENATSLDFFCRYHFGRCFSEMSELVIFRYSCGFSVPIPRYYKDIYVYVYVFFFLGPFNSKSAINNKTLIKYCY